MDTQALLRRFILQSQDHDPMYNMVTTHSHGFHELFYLDKGECELTVGTTGFSLKSGALVIIRQDVQHKTAYAPGMEHTRTTVEFGDDYVNPFRDRFTEEWINENLFNKVFYIPEDKRDWFKEELQKIEYAHIHALDEAGFLKAQLLFDVFLIDVFDYESFDPEVQRFDKPLPVDTTIVEALKYIDEHYKEDISLESTSRELNINATYLSKKFSDLVGVGLTQYINSKKIIYAERLLLETNYTVQQIAEMVGLSNLQYFSSLFRRKNGTTALAFRNCNGNIRGAVWASTVAGAKPKKTKRILKGRVKNDVNSEENLEIAEAAEAKTEE